VSLEVLGVTTRSRRLDGISESSDARGGDYEVKKACWK